MHSQCPICIEIFLKEQIMFINFFFALRDARLLVSLREYLTLMQADLADYQIEAFYALARSILVKDERHFDRFDQVFLRNFKGIISQIHRQDKQAKKQIQELPAEWLHRMAEKYLTAEEKEQIKNLGGFETLMETLRKRLAEQQKRHQGGSKWIGTVGTSPFGAYGYNPEGIRIGQSTSHHQRAVKIWDRCRISRLG